MPREDLMKWLAHSLCLSSYHSNWSYSHMAETHKLQHGQFAKMGGIMGYGIWDMG